MTRRAPTGSAFAQSIWIRDIRLHIICARGFSPQSIVMMKAFRKRRLPPSSIHPATSGGWPVLICGRESTTWASLKRLRLESSPRNGWALEILAALYRCKGMYKEAVQAWEDMFSARGDEVSASSVRRAFAEGGYAAVVRWKLADLKKRSLQHYVSPVFFALAHAQLEQREETLSSLEEAYRGHDPLLLWVQDEPAYDFVHSDERYRAIIKGMGLPPAY